LFFIYILPLDIQYITSDLNAFRLKIYYQKSGRKLFFDRFFDKYLNAKSQD